MNIKLLFSDLDGTLVEHGSDITDSTLEGINKLREHGVDIILVTGRHADMTRSIYSKIGAKTPVIGCNGGIIKDLNTNEILYVNPIKKEIIKKSIDIARKLGIDWVVYEQNHMFFENPPPQSYKMPYDNLILPDHLKANFVHVHSLDEVFKEDYVFLKILLLFDNNMNGMAEGIEMLKDLKDVVILRSANMYLDVMPMGSTKGTAVKRYLDLVQVSRENIASIGDAQNDLDMIEFAHLGIAMGNAVDALKEVAQHITSNQPEGFLDAVDYIINLSPKKVE